MNSYNKLIHILVLITYLYLFRSPVGHILVLIVDLYLLRSPVGHILVLIAYLYLYLYGGVRRYYQGLKNCFFRPIFRRKIGFRLGWKQFWEEKIGSKKIGEKSKKNSRFFLYFPEKIRFFPKFLIFSLFFP